MSSFPNPLTVALPFVFVTNELHVLPVATLQNGPSPPSIVITKNYFKPHVEEIKREFSEVQTMGAATAEEWVKGLEDRGKERKNDAARWERWDASGGVARMHILEPQEISKATISSRTSKTSTPNPPGVTNGHPPTSQAQYSTQVPTNRLPQLPNLPQPIHTTFCKCILILLKICLKLISETRSNKPPTTFRFTLSEWGFALPTTPLSACQT